MRLNRNKTKLRVVEFLVGGAVREGRRGTAATGSTPSFGSREQRAHELSELATGPPAGSRQQAEGGVQWAVGGGQWAVGSGQWAVADKAPPCPGGSVPRPGPAAACGSLRLCDLKGALSQHRRGEGPRGAVRAKPWGPPYQGGRTGPNKTHYGLCCSPGPAAALMGPPCRPLWEGFRGLVSGI